MPYSYPHLPNQFVRDYIEAALWSTIDESGGVPLDQNYGIEDIEDETIKDMILDCEAFQEANADDLALVDEVSDGGYDFWLTRHGHGTGFWDRGYRQPKQVQDALERLSNAAAAFGDYDLYIDDGVIRANRTRASVARYKRLRAIATPHGRCEHYKKCIEHAQDSSIPSCKRTRRRK